MKLWNAPKGEYDWLGEVLVSFRPRHFWKTQMYLTLVGDNFRFAHVVVSSSPSL